MLILHQKDPFSFYLEVDVVLQFWQGLKISKKGYQHQFPVCRQIIFWVKWREEGPWQCWVWPGEKQEILSLLQTEHCSGQASKEKGGFVIVHFSGLMAKNASYLLSLFIFSSCLLSFLSLGHLPFICLLALKSLTKCAKKFPERNPNNPLLIKYTSSKQSPSVTALTRLQRCRECCLSVTSEKCFSFSV